MKRILLFLTVLVMILFASCGDDQYSNITEYVSKEAIYPGKYDFAKVSIGFERVEIDLLEAGRIPSSEIKLGKAVKTVVEYDDEVIVFDELRSWVNIEGLDRQKMYNFRIYTMDAYGNKSVPVEPKEPVMPYFKSDVANLNVPQPRVNTTGKGVLLSWPRALLDRMMRHTGLEYKYVDPKSEKHEGTAGAFSSVLVKNVDAGDQVTVDLVHSVIPVINGVPILDTVYLTQRVELLVPKFIPWTNIALGKRVLVDSNIDGNIGKNAVNGNRADYWMSADNNDNHWIEIDLAAAYTVEAVEIVTKEGKPLKNFDFQVWVVDRWVNRLNVTNNSDVEFSALFDKTVTSRVRLLTRGQPVEISQIEVYVIEENPELRTNVALFRHCLVNNFRNANESGYQALDGRGTDFSNSSNSRWVLVNRANQWMEIYFEGPVTIEGFRTSVDTDASRDYLRRFRFRVCDDTNEEQHPYPYAFPHPTTKNSTASYTLNNLSYAWVPFPQPTNVNWRTIYEANNTNVVREVIVNFNAPVTTNKVRFEIDDQEMRLFQIEIFSTIKLFD